MDKRFLGKTGLEVTELCFGALPMGPRQKNLDVDECADIIAHALKKGVNFVDTAQMYETYEPIQKAIKAVNIRPVISTKSAAAGYEEMDLAVNEAFNKLNVDYIDLFFLHAARAGVNVFNERKGALQCLLDYKNKGKIKAVGISTHNTSVARMTALRDDIDVLFVILNKKGIGVLGGTLEDMKEALKLNAENGKGILLMKVLGGGNLLNDYKECIDFARNIKDYTSIAIGMVSKQEVDFNIDCFNGSYDEDKMPNIQKNAKEFQVFETLCKGCGSCVKVCPNFAMEFDETKNKAFINRNLCLRCGYCTSACREFAIRLI